MRAVLLLPFCLLVGNGLPAVGQDFIALLEWGRTKCDMTIPFDLQQRTTGARDIFTNEPLKGLDTVFAIPEKCLITTAKAIEHPSTYGLFDPQMASESPERREFFEKRKFYDSILLPLYLLHLIDEGDNGFFAPYVRVLPKDVDNFVCLWDDETASLLPFNTLVDSFTICNKIRAMYDDICVVVPAFCEQRKFEDWQRVWLLANSRDLDLTVNGEKHTALAPIYDSFNHAMEANIRWNYSIKRGGVVGEVMRMNARDGKFYVDEGFVVPAGTELNLSYSLFSQSKLLLYYGFTLSCGWERRWQLLLSGHTAVGKESEHDVQSNMAAPRCYDKLKLRTDDASYELTATRDGTDDFKFIESVRQSLERADTSDETLVWRTIYRLIKSVEFPLSISEAGPLLEAATPGSNEYNALNVLIGQWSVSLAWMLHSAKMASPAKQQTKEEGTTSTDEL